MGKPFDLKGRQAISREAAIEDAADSLPSGVPFITARAGPGGNTFSPDHPWAWLTWEGPADEIHLSEVQLHVTTPRIIIG